MHIKFLLKIIFFSILSLGILFLLNPLWSSVELGRSLHHIRLNEVGVVQIIPMGADFKVLNTSGDLDIAYQNEVSIRIPISKEWNTRFVNVDVLKSGKVSLVFKGVEKVEDSRNYKIPVDYKNLKINGKVIMNDSFRLLGSEQYQVDNIQMELGKPFQISVEIKKAKLKLQDLKQVFGVKAGCLIVSFFISCGTAFFLAFLLKKLFLKSGLPFSTFLFCISVFALLIVPILVIDKSQANYQENRMLSLFPSFLKEGRFNLQFGTEMDSWFNDHFGGRKKLIRLYGRAHYMNTIIRNNQASYNKKTGWMFGTKAFFNPSSEQVKTIIKNVKSLDEFCQKNGIKLYLMTVPSKETIYKKEFYEQFPGNKNIEDLEKEHIEKMKPVLSVLEHGRVIYPYSELKEASQRVPVFYRESHHWTDDGAFVGYQKLIAVIQQDFPEVLRPNLSEYNVTTSNKIRDSFERDYNTGDTARLLNISPKYSEKYILKTPYTYYDGKIPLNVEVRDIPRYRTKHFINPKSQNSYRVFLSGFSQNDSFLQFLPYSFKELVFYRLNNVKEVKTEDNSKFMQRYQKDLLVFKPDILILTISPLQLLETNLFKE